MDTPYLIEEYLQMSASGEAKLKFPMWERQMFQEKEFFVTKRFLSAYLFITTPRIGEQHVIFAIKTFLFTC